MSCECTIGSDGRVDSSQGVVDHVDLVGGVNSLIWDIAEEHPLKLSTVLKLCSGHNANNLKMLEVRQTMLQRRNGKRLE